MIRYTIRDLGVADHRTLRRQTTPERPVVTCPPNARRSSALRSQQLRAMGMASDAVAAGDSADLKLRWWDAWTTTIVDEATVLASRSTDPKALATYLLQLEQRTDTVTVLLSEAAGEAHGRTLHALDGTPIQHSPPDAQPEADPATAPSGVMPTVPRVDTTAFLATARAALGPAAAPIEEAYRSVQTAVLDARPASAADVLALLGEVTGEGGNDRLLVGLHALRAASWQLGLPLRFRPEDVVRQSGRLLTARTTQRLWWNLLLQPKTERAVTMCLATLGWSCGDILNLTVADGAVLQRDATLPHGVRLTLQAQLHARTANDDAGSTDPLIAYGPAGGRRRVTQDTVRRWITCASIEHGAPGPTGRRQLGPTTAVDRLGALGLEWADA